MQAARRETLSFDHKRAGARAGHRPAVVEYGLQPHCSGLRWAFWLALTRRLPKLKVMNIIRRFRSQKRSGLNTRRFTTNSSPRPKFRAQSAKPRDEFTPQMRDILVMTDALRAELPHMLEEHKAIRAATARMGAAAKAKGNAAVERLAETLKLHAQSEEQIFYSAAILVGVGDLVRHHFRAKAPRP